MLPPGFGEGGWKNPVQGSGGDDGRLLAQAGLTHAATMAISQSRRIMLRRATVGDDTGLGSLGAELHDKCVKVL